jgi:hypothetical protein
MRISCDLAKDCNGLRYPNRLSSYFYQRLHARKHVGRFRSAGLSAMATYWAIRISNVCQGIPLKIV